MADQTPQLAVEASDRSSPDALGAAARAPGDPTFHLDVAGAVSRTTLSVDGPATLRFEQRSPDELRCSGWEPGAAAAAAQAELVGSLASARTWAATSPALDLAVLSNARNVGGEVTLSSRPVHASAKP